MDPTPSPRERFADGLIHVIGVTLGLAAVIAMLAAAIPSLPVPATASLTIYGVGTLAMLGCSAAYHLSQAPAWKAPLRRLDRAAIFIKIAATYTPFAFVKMKSPVGDILLAGVWTVACLGAACQLFLRSRWDKTAVVLYLALGWAGVLAFPSLAAAITSETLVLLGLGGALYSIGVIFHLWETLPFQNAVWHIFVLAATACHFGAVVTALFG